MADTTIQEWRDALRNDERSLARYQAALKKLRRGEKVGYMTVAGAKNTISGLKEVIKNKKKLIKSLEKRTRRLPE